MSNKETFLKVLLKEPIQEDNNSDTLTIRFEDQSMFDKYKLPDISYDNFSKFLFRAGDSYSKYEEYLRENQMKELTDFNEDGIRDLYLVLEDGFRQKRVIFKAIVYQDKLSEKTPF